MEQYNIKPINVSIRTLTIDNKKLTRSIFNQVEWRRCFDENMDFIGDHIYGYVKEKANRYLVWVHEGKLRRYNLSDYYKIKKNASDASFENTNWFCYQTKIEFTYDDEYQPSDWIKDKEKYNMLAGKVHSFLEGLWEKQIYL